MTEKGKNRIGDAEVERENNANAKDDPEDNSNKIDFEKSHIMLLETLTNGNSKSNRIQIVTFSFGVLISILSVFQQLFGFPIMRADGDSFIFAALILGAGFAIIISSLVIVQRQNSTDRSVRAELLDRSNVANSTSSNASESRLSEMRKTAPAPLHRIHDRLKEHLDRLRGFAFANIIIGSLIAAAGIGVIFSLFSGVLDIHGGDISSIRETDYMAFILILFLPRISIVILIQIFAYFFLSMYRANLREIRYFQIELNDIDLMAEGLQLATQGNFGIENKDTIDKIFNMVKYRGDTFRAAIASDEALETFEKLSVHGNILETVKELTGSNATKQPLRKRRRTSTSSPVDGKTQN
ncbi:hypothetical protein [Rhizobium sp. G21]|uniref:hypothetical protein n=1 Tax=Rhizobium sp. G21 TaxID=2758439 RepID=UPI001600750D|nr:hypothetical protein [Rhizobium sp. G21]MBB1251183.1 hypothetical protein [Rhizobium sp. G21]